MLDPFEDEIAAMALGSGAYAAVRRGIELGFLVGGAIWVAAWPMFGIMMKRRWGYGPISMMPQRPRFVAPSVRPRTAGCR
jgi:hypothetical protein